MSREAMRMALEALESDPVSHAGLVNRKQAITALRQALEIDLARVGEVGVWGKALEKEPLYWSVADGWVYADDISQERVDGTVKQEHEPVVNIVTGLRLKETI